MHHVESKKTLLRGNHAINDQQAVKGLGVD